MYSHTVEAVYRSRPMVLELPHVAYTSKVAAREKFPFKYRTPTTIGIEVEIENVSGSPIDETRWHVERDASLRNGIELISYPLRDNEVLEALGGLSVWFDSNPLSVFSHRCSNHIHVDVTKLTYEQLLVFIGFYLTAENLFFDAFFPTRKGNNYCFPLNNTTLTQESIKRENLIVEIWKYAALNLYHLKDYGTVEFRHHPGTKDVEDLFSWIKTCLAIYDFAKRTKMPEFKEMLAGLNTSSGYSEYIRKALPDWRHPINADQMYDSVTAAKYFIFNA